MVVGATYTVSSLHNVPENGMKVVPGLPRYRSGDLVSFLNVNLDKEHLSMGVNILIKYSPAFTTTLDPEVICRDAPRGDGYVSCRHLGGLAN
eukprot:SAG11_NODE_2508_length_3271_cov_5.144388_3_plen_92_part_00